MSAEPTLVYLEADDEITTVVRRMRAADPGRVVIVAPGRSRATSSAVALRLLARVAERDGREIGVVGDALTRSLAAEAGIGTYASVEDARAAKEEAAPETLGTQTAAIHVVRGSGREETPATLPALAVASDTETRVTRTPAAPVRPPGPQRRRPPRPAPRRRRLSWIAALIGLALVLGAWGVIAAAVLPAATITIVPRVDAIGPIADVVPIPEPDHISGAVNETATVTATGTYDEQVKATGTVTFFNWNSNAADIPVGSLVAAGEQAFETLADIRVPAGRFDFFGGGITAGEASVAVRASAAGPDGNVAAEAIDTILDRGLAARLRGFPTITSRLVDNEQPTSGGASSSGPEITQEDVDAAVEALQQALEAAMADALAGSADLLFVDPAEPVAPEIEGLDDLVGKRDSSTVEISGSQSYDRLAVDPAAVTSLAIERFTANTALVPAGWHLVEDATDVSLGEVTRQGDSLAVAVSVTGAATPEIERGSVLARVIGLSKDAAANELSDLGSITVSLWPGWVSTVPDSDWRIDLHVDDSTTNGP